MQLAFEISLVGNAAHGKGSIYPFDPYDWVDDAADQIIDDLGNQLCFYDTEVFDIVDDAGDTIIDDTSDTLVIAKAY